MAERRMFAKTIIDSDAFLDLPVAAQALYFHLAMRADDDGFVNKPRAVMNMVGAKNDDMKILIAKKFVIHFESGVVVIKHWRIHNYIRKDTYNETKYKFEKASLYLDENNSYSVNDPSTELQRLENGQSTQVRLCEVRLGEERVEKENNENIPFYLSSEKKPKTDIDWEALARVSLKLGNESEALRYAQKAQEEDRPFDFEALKQSVSI